MVPEGPLARGELLLLARRGGRRRRRARAAAEGERGAELGARRRGGRLVVRVESVRIKVWLLVRKGAALLGVGADVGAIQRSWGSAGEVASVRMDRYSSEELQVHVRRGNADWTGGGPRNLATLESLQTSERAGSREGHASVGGRGRRTAEARRSAACPELDCG